jgi:hypothetical protein
LDFTGDLVEYKVRQPLKMARGSRREIAIYHPKEIFYFLKNGMKQVHEGIWFFSFKLIPLNCTYS